MLQYLQWVMIDKYFNALVCSENIVIALQEFQIFQKYCKFRMHTNII